MKCYYCGNTDSSTIKKLEGYYHYKCLKCGFEVDGTLILYPPDGEDFEFDEFPDDYFEVEK